MQAPEPQGFLVPAGEWVSHVSRLLVAVACVMGAYGPSCGFQHSETEGIRLDGCLQANSSAQLREYCDVSQLPRLFCEVSKQLHVDRRW